MSDIIWEQYSHQYMWDTVQGGPGVGAAQNTVDSWGRAQQHLAEIDGTLATALNSITGQWDGIAADATRTGLTPLGMWVTDAAARASTGATSLVEQADQVAWVRNNLPPPPRQPTALDEQIFGPIPTPSATEPWYAPQQRAAETQRIETRAQALHVMNTYSANSEATQLPLTPPPPPPVVTMGGAGGPATGSGSASSGGVRARSADGPGSIRATTPSTGLASGGADGGAAARLAPTATAATGGSPSIAGGGIAGEGRIAAEGALPGGDGAAAGPGATGTGASGTGTGAAGAGLPAAAGLGRAATGTAGGTSMAGGTRPTGSGGAGAGGLGTGTGAGRSVSGGFGPGGSGFGSSGSGSPASRGTAAPGVADSTPGYGRAPGSGHAGSPTARPGTGYGGTGPGSTSPGGGTSGYAGAGGRATGYGTPGHPLGERGPNGAPRTAEPLSWRNDPNITGRGPDGQGRPPDLTEHRPTRPPLTAAVDEPHPIGSRGAGSAGQAMMPMGAGMGGQQSQGRRRPGYLIDDSGAFVDDRWFTEPVITPDDPLPPPPRR